MKCTCAMFLGVFSRERKQNAVCYCCITTVKNFILKSSYKIDKIQKKMKKKMVLSELYRSTSRSTDWVQ